jgi:predicted unusual protein kinase regulating ubiquinone biosynthesis (AarF/ABC1/UbiB family)
MFDFIIIWCLTVLVNFNVLFVKLFQAVSSKRFDFRKYTNKASFTKQEIDFELLQEIIQTYNIELTQLEPINSGMIAIVFKGTMNDKQIIIKMRRNNVKARLERGYDQLIWLYDWISYWFEKNKIVKSLASIVKMRAFMLEQCDFKQEIYAMKTYKRELLEIEHMPKSENIIVPEVYNIGEESRFIVMEFLEGVDGFSVQEKDKEEYAYLLYTNALIMLCITSIYHTDLHPGNIIFMKDYKLGIIDFGMWITMPEDMRLSTLTNMGSLFYSGKMDGFKLLAPYFEPNLNKDILTDEQYKLLCEIFERLCIKMLTGNMKPEIVTEFQEAVYNIYPKQVYMSKIGLNVLLATAMVDSTIYQLVKGDSTKIGAIQAEVIKHLTS